MKSVACDPPDAEYGGEGDLDGDRLVWGRCPSKIAPRAADRASRSLRDAPHAANRGIFNSMDASRTANRAIHISQDAP